LKTIKQRRIGEITNYFLEFNRYSDESSWNEEAKIDAFLNGLNDQIITKIYQMFPGPRSLFALQTIASRIDSHIAAHRQFSNPKNKSNNNNNNDTRNNNRNNNNRRQNKGKNLSNSIPEVLCLMKKSKEEEKNIFVPIVDQLIIPLTIAH